MMEEDEVPIIIINGNESTKRNISQMPIIRFWGRKKKVFDLLWWHIQCAIKAELPVTVLWETLKLCRATTGTSSNEKHATTANKGRPCRCS